jgi:hypothetical protein
MEKKALWIGGNIYLATTNEMQAVTKNKSNTNTPAPAYFPLKTNFGTTKYINIYERNI